MKVHFKRHKSTEDIVCPEDGCNEIFGSFYRFSSHVQKKHASCSDLTLISNSNGSKINSLKSQDSSSLSSSSMQSDSTSSSSSRTETVSSASDKIKKEESAFTSTCSQSLPDKKLVISSMPSTSKPVNHHDHQISSSSSIKIDTDLNDHQQITKQDPSLRNDFQMSATSLEPEKMDDIDPSTSFQPQYTEAQFNYTTSTDNTLKAETLSTSNPSDILSLLHQSFFTIDDSEASLKLLSYLATQGNLQIFDQDNQLGLPSQHADLIEPGKEQQQSINVTAATGFDKNAVTTYPDFSLFSNVVSSALGSAQPQNTHQPLNQSHQLAPFENQNNIQQTALAPTFAAAVNGSSNVLPNSLLDNVNLTNNSFNSFFLDQGHQPLPHQSQQQQQQQQRQQQQKQQQLHLQQQSIFASPDGSFSHQNDQSFPNNISEMTQQYNINTQAITKHEIEQPNYLHNPAAQTMMFDSNNLHYQ